MTRLPLGRMIERAAAELEAVAALAREFHRECAATLGGRKWHAHFEQWLWAARADWLFSGAPLPVIPNPLAPAAAAELSRKLSLAGRERAETAGTCKRLEVLASTLAAELPPPGRTATSKDTISVTEFPLNDPGLQQPASGLLALKPTQGGPRVLVSRLHFDKLRKLHAAASASRDCGEGPGRDMASSSCTPPRQTGHGDQTFLADAYCVLARVLALQGGEMRAGGMQAACSNAVFDALHADFGLKLEGFASPVNCRFVPFCSAAEDVDAAFGSLGSFYGERAAVALRQGCHLLNPPYDAAAVSALAIRVDALLHEATAANDVLTFFIVIPYWPDKPCWRMLNDSVHRSATMLLPQCEHGFCEGAQQYRPTIWRLSNHPSSVFILQSPAARTSQAWGSGPEQRLRAAFATPVQEPPSAIIVPAQMRASPKFTAATCDAERFVNERAEQGKQTRPKVSTVPCKAAEDLGHRRRSWSTVLQGMSGKQRKKARKKIREKQRALASTRSHQDVHHKGITVPTIRKA